MISDYKFLISKDCYLKAMNYAIISKDYTDGHGKGWDEKYNKFERIFQGELSKYFIYDLLRVNNISTELYETDHTMPDKGDLLICGKVFDVKSSTVIKLLPQVQKKNMNADIDYFIFCIMNDTFEWIQINGYIDKDIVCNNKYFIEYGSVIPNTKWDQKLKGGSYFYTGELKPIEKILNIKK